MYIDPESLSDFSVDKVEKMFAELKSSHFTPFPGRFGIGGPYSTSLGSVDSNDHTAVFYFKNDSEPAASSIAAIVSRTLSITDVKPKFAKHRQPAAKKTKYAL